MRATRPCTARPTAGKTFLPFKGAPGGDDYHQLWIDPADPRRMIVGERPGRGRHAWTAAKTWSSWYNQPTAQFYHVATDNRFPYWIYGAQQDSGAAATPSRTDYRSITPARLAARSPRAARTDTSRPTRRDPDIVFGGGVGRFDWKTLQEQDVDPDARVPGRLPRRVDAAARVLAARTRSALYFGNQFLFRTTDGGRHWEKVSPDLTREDPGVPATLDAVTARGQRREGPAARRHLRDRAVAAFATELVWCGTDDGLIWLTRDDGEALGERHAAGR